NPDGVKVGGHQASSSSIVSLLTVLYFGALRPDDLVAVKAHASPAFYAIQYLRGRLTAEALRGLRTFGGLQAYASRRKNAEGVAAAAVAEEVVARLANVLWIVDVNRQSLDRIVPDGRLRQMRAMFEAGGWRVSELRWGRKLQSFFGKRGGERLRERLQIMPN